MAKPIKIILALLGTLLLLLVAAVIVLPLLFDPNDFRGKLAETVKKETGREFSVGAIRLSVFPWLQVELDDVVLGNAAGFVPAQMLTVKSANLGVKLLPLLREKRVEASKVRLVGVRAALAVSADGVSNWDDLLTRQKAKTDDAAKPGSNTALRNLDIAGIELDDVAVSFVDLKAKHQYTVENLKLKTGRLHAGEAFPVTGSLLARSGFDTTVALDFNTEMQLDAATGSVHAQALRVKVDASLTGAIPLNTQLELKTAGLQFDATARKLSTQPLTLEIASFTQGDKDAPRLTAKGVIGTTLAADLATKRYAAQALDIALEVAGTSVPGGKPQSLKVGGALTADLAAQTAQLSALIINFAGLDIRSAKLAVENLSGDLPTASGDLSVAPFDPRILLAKLAITVPATADAQVLKQASLSTQLSATANGLALKNLTLKLDDTIVRGDFSVRDFTSQALAFALKADSLNADRYLPPVKAAPAGEAPSKKIDVNSVELPVQALDKLNANGTLDIAKLTLKGVAMSGVQLKLTAPKGGTKRQQLSAGLYGGHADIALNVSPGSKPAYLIKTVFNGINTGPLLKDFLGKDYVSGQGSLTLDVSTSGRTVGEVKRALNGEVAFNLVNGAVKGFNLAKIIRDGQALLAPQTSLNSSASDASSTDFAELRGNGKFVNGVLKSDQLSAKSPLLRLEGAGELDLAGETINYLAKPSLVNTATGQGGKAAADIYGIVIPIRLTGNLYKPKVQIDWQAALQQRAADKLRGQYEAHKEEYQQKAVEQINKGLLRLFGNKQPPPSEPVP